LLGNRVTADLGITLRPRDETADHRDRGRFPSAVRPDQAKDLPLVDIEVSNTQYGEDMVE
jgi:hypothetical protein